MAITCLLSSGLGDAILGAGCHVIVCVTWRFELIDPHEGVWCGGSLVLGVATQVAAAAPLGGLGQ